MDEKIIGQLTRLTDEERDILRGRGVREQDYTDSDRFIISGAKLLEGEKLALRPHTRFVDFPEHGHDYMEFMYVYAGKITHVVGGEKITLERGDILFLNRHIRHSILRAAQEDVGINFILSDDFLRPIFPHVRNNAVMSDFLSNNFDDAGEPEYLFFRTKDNFPIRNLMDNLIYAIGNRTQEMYADILSLLFSYLAYYRDALANALRIHSADARFKHSVSDYLERSYAGATLNGLASLLGYSLSYLSRRVRLCFGKTFRQLLQERRLAAAEELLRTSQMSVEEIVRAVGYENQAHFYRVFFRTYHTTPYRYRKNRE